MIIDIDDPTEIALIISSILDSCEIPELTELEQQELRYYVLNGSIQIASDCVDNIKENQNAKP